MKSSLWIILLILVAIVSFLIGYSLAPTDVSVVRHGAVGQKPASAGGGYGGSGGGYGASSGGYGAPTGGYGAPTGGYGAPTGGYGAPTGSSGH